MRATSAEDEDLSCCAALGGMEKLLTSPPYFAAELRFLECECECEAYIEAVEGFVDGGVGSMEDMSVLVGELVSFLLESTSSSSNSSSSSSSTSSSRLFCTPYD